MDSGDSAVVKDVKTVTASAKDIAEGTVDATGSTSKYVTAVDNREDLPSSGTYEATEVGEDKGGDETVSEGLVVEEVDPSSEQSILSYLS